MSTKSSIKHKAMTDESPGYHLYDDVMDQYRDDGEPPVYLRLDGVPVELYTLGVGASVTVTIPRAIARELGLLNPPSTSGASK